MIFRHVDSKLTAYLHGELPPRARRMVERHLSGCTRCRRLLTELGAASTNVSDLPLSAPPERVWDRIETRLNAGAEQVRPHPLRARRAFLPIAAACAAVAVVAVSLATSNRLRQRGPTWDVRRIEGSPAIGWLSVHDHARMAVGDSLTTDSRSRAEISVADIGTVQVAPGSRVRLGATGAKQHRLELERGALEARVTAPPRLFVVDTTVGRAVDLGCAYRLTTDGAHLTTLKVTRGEVALEDRGRSILVPEGFTCESRSSGVGTPVQDRAAQQMRDAIRHFDFEGGGAASIEQARLAAKPLDAYTLWSLLGRAPESERQQLFDTVAQFARVPRGVTRRGIVQGDPRMMLTWRDTILYDYAEAEFGP